MEEGQGLMGGSERRRKRKRAMGRRMRAVLLRPVTPETYCGVSMSHLMLCAFVLGFLRSSDRLLSFCARFGVFWIDHSLDMDFYGGNLGQSVQSSVVHCTLTEAN